MAIPEVAVEAVAEEEVEEAVEEEEAEAGQEEEEQAEVVDLNLNLNNMFPGINQEEVGILLQNKITTMNMGKNTTMSMELSMQVDIIMTLIRASNTMIISNIKSRINLLNTNQNLSKISNNMFLSKKLKETIDKYIPQKTIGKSKNRVINPSLS